MNALLISTNLFSEPMPVLPIGMAYLSQALKANGHQVSALDLFWEKDCKTAILSKIQNEKPDLIGISIRNTDDYNIDPPNLLLPFIRMVVAFIVEAGFPTDRIIAGGAAVSDLQVPLLRYIGVKYGCFGEGEKLIVDVASRIEEGKDFGDVPGIFSDAHAPVSATRAPDGFRDYFRPDWSIYDRRYFNQGNKYGFTAHISIQTKRGCRFKCVYCNVPSIEGRRLRMHAVESVVEEMVAASARFPDVPMDIIDNDFNLPPSHAEAVCEVLIERKLKLNWSCAIHPSFSSQRLVELLKRANCQHIDIGTETVSPRMAKNLGRPFCPKEKLIALNQWCKDLQIETCHAMSLGGPGEDFDTLSETFGALEKMNPHGKPTWPTVVFYGGLRIYPNTPLAQTAVDEGLIWPGHPLLFPQFYLSPGVDAKACDLIAKAKSRHAEWLFKGTELQRRLAYYGLLAGDRKAIVEDAAKEEKKPMLPGDLMPPDGQLELLNGCFEAIDAFWQDRPVLLLIAWQKNNMHVKMFYEHLAKKFASTELKMQAIASVPPLPSFVTRDFIKSQLREAEKIVHRIIIDWDSSYIQGQMRLPLNEKCLFIGVRRGGQISFIRHAAFDLNELESVVQIIKAKLLRSTPLPDNSAVTTMPHNTDSPKKGNCTMATQIDEITAIMTAANKFMNDNVAIAEILNSIEAITLHVHFTDLNAWVTQKIGAGRIETFDGQVGTATVVEHIDSATFKDVMSGAVEPPEAAMAGKIQFEGDFSKMLLMQPLLPHIRESYQKAMKPSDSTVARQYTNIDQIVTDMNKVYEKLNTDPQLIPMLKEIGSLTIHIEYTDLDSWASFRIKEGKVGLFPGKVGKPTVIERLDSNTYYRIMRGHVEPQEEVMAGKIQFEGDFSRMLVLQPFIDSIRKGYNELCEGEIQGEKKSI